MNLCGGRPVKAVRTATTTFNESIGLLAATERTRCNKDLCGLPLRQHDRTPKGPS
jgi:hypothetical protein